MGHNPFGGSFKSPSGFHILYIEHTDIIFFLFFDRIARFKKLGSNLREQCITQYVLFLFSPLAKLGLVFLHLRLKQIGRAAGNGFHLTVFVDAQGLF